MRKETRDRWIADLRSGKYEQHRGNLSKNYTGINSTAFCCLGILFYKTLNGDDCYEYDNLAKNEHITSILVNMNDIEKKSFPEIADWIEQNVPVT